MPFGNQEAVRCPRCNQAVFHAESIPAAGKQWHKTCYRCGMLDFCLNFFCIISNVYFDFSKKKWKGLCKKMLEPMTMAEHEGNVYCKQCYGRKFGIRGVGFGIGAGALAMDTGDRFGNTESLSNKPNYATPPGAAAAKVSSTES
ncbi:unnamed protein product [Rotaria sp. Silwood2]|nr:unnamed protein product [Rotaria sp. Silwood2]